MWGERFLATCVLPLLTCEHPWSFLLALAQRAAICCLQGTHLHAEQSPGVLLSGMVAHSPDVAAQRSFTGISFVFTRTNEITFRTDTYGGWASVQIECTGITITLVCVYTSATGPERSSFLPSSLAVLGGVNCIHDPHMARTNSHTTCHKAGAVERSQCMLKPGL